MPADAPTALSIITSALRKLSVLGAAESAPNAEDTQLGLDELNELRAGGEAGNIDPIVDCRRLRYDDIDECDRRRSWLVFRRHRRV